MFSNTDGHKILSDDKGISDIMFSYDVCKKVGDFIASAEADFFNFTFSGDKKNLVVPEFRAFLEYAKNNQKKMYPLVTNWSHALLDNNKDSIEKDTNISEEIVYRAILNDISEYLTQYCVYKINNIKKQHIGQMHLCHSGKTDYLSKIVCADDALLPALINEYVFGNALPDIDLSSKKQDKKTTSPEEDKLNIASKPKTKQAQEQHITNSIPFDFSHITSFLETFEKYVQENINDNKEQDIAIAEAEEPEIYLSLEDVMKKANLTKEEMQKVQEVFTLETDADIEVVKRDAQRVVEQGGFLQNGTGYQSLETWIDATLQKRLEDFDFNLSSSVSNDTYEQKKHLNRLAGLFVGEITKINDIVWMPSLYDSIKKVSKAFTNQENAVNIKDFYVTESHRNKIFNDTEQVFLYNLKTAAKQEKFNDKLKGVLKAIFDFHWTEKVKPNAKYLGKQYIPIKKEEELLELLKTKIDSLYYDIIQKIDSTLQQDLEAATTIVNKNKTLDGKKEKLFIPFDQNGDPYLPMLDFLFLYNNLSSNQDDLYYFNSQGNSPAYGNDEFKNFVAADATNIPLGYKKLDNMFRKQLISKNYTSYSLPAECYIFLSCAFNLTSSEWKKWYPRMTDVYTDMIKDGKSPNERKNHVEFLQRLKQKYPNDFKDFYALYAAGCNINQQEQFATYAKALNDKFNQSNDKSQNLKFNPDFVFFLLEHLEGFTNKTNKHAQSFGYSAIGSSSGFSSIFSYDCLKKILAPDKSYIYRNEIGINMFIKNIDKLPDLKTDDKYHNSFKTLKSNISHLKVKYDQLPQEIKDKLQNGLAQSGQATNPPPNPKTTVPKAPIPQYNPQIPESTIVLSEAENTAIEAFVKYCKDNKIEMVSFDFDNTLTTKHSFEHLQVPSTKTVVVEQNKQNKIISDKDIFFWKTLMKNLKSSSINPVITSFQYEENIQHMLDIKDADDIVINGQNKFQNYLQNTNFVSDSAKKEPFLQQMQKKVLHFDDTKQVIDVFKKDGDVRGFCVNASKFKEQFIQEKFVESLPQFTKKEKLNPDLSQQVQPPIPKTTNPQEKKLPSDQKTILKINCTSINQEGVDKCVVSLEGKKSNILTFKGHVNNNQLFLSQKDEKSGNNTNLNNDLFGKIIEETATLVLDNQIKNSKESSQIEDQEHECKKDAVIEKTIILLRSLGEMATKYPNLKGEEAGFSAWKNNAEFIKIIQDKTAEMKNQKGTSVEKNNNNSEHEYNKEDFQLISAMMQKASIKYSVEGESNRFYWIKEGDYYKPTKQGARSYRLGLVFHNLEQCIVKNPKNSLSV